MILLLISIALMLILAYEDFRNREISVIWIAIFYLIILIEVIQSNNWSLENIIINVIVFIFLGLGVVIYSMVRWGTKRQIINRTIGLGDILLAPSFIFIFSPANFLIFLNTGFLLGIIFYILSKKRSAKIPLAGIFAMVYSILLITSIAHIDYSILFQDDVLNIILRE